MKCDISGREGKQHNQVSHSRTWELTTQYIRHICLWLVQILMQVTCRMFT